MVLGAVAVHFLTISTLKIRRVTYFWALILIQLFGLALAFSLGFVPFSASIGLFSAHIAAVSVSVFLLGAFLYYASCARSNDITGTRKQAFWVIIPFGVFLLLLRSGQKDSNDHSLVRSKFGRYVLDPALVLTGVLAIFAINGFSQTFDQYEFPSNYDEAFASFVYKNLPKSRIFDEIVTNNAKELPVELGDGLTWVDLTAHDAGLNIVVEVADNSHSDLEDFERWITTFICMPDMFGQEIEDEAHINVFFVDTSNKDLSSALIDQNGCAT